MVDRPVLDPDALAAGLLAAGWPTQRIEVVAETGSTNADLHLAAGQGAPEWAVRIASYQTAGRGRFQRAWASPAGSSVAISVLLRPTRPMDRWPWLSLITGVALAESFDRFGVSARVKWPNDVLAPGGKLCGILLERATTAQGAALIVGFGINLAMTADELPVPTASSLLLEGATPDPVAVVIDVLGRWRELVNDWREGDDPALLQRYLAISGTIGRQVKVLIDESGEAAITGRATGVDDLGRLLVETAEGTRAFSAGDVVHLR